MKFRAIISVIKLSCCLISAPLGCGSAEAAVLNFDDLIFNGIADTIPDGYKGFNWNNFNVGNAPAQLASFGINGYTYGNVSSPNYAFNAYGEPASVTRTSHFSVTTMYITAAWNDGLSVTVSGSLAGSQLYSSTYIINSEKPTLVTLDFRNIDTLSFVTSGGTNPGYTGGNGTQVVIDDLSYNVGSVPLPSTAPLFGGAILGFACVGYVAKRKKAARVA